MGKRRGISQCDKRPQDLTLADYPSSLLRTPLRHIWSTFTCCRRASKCLGPSIQGNPAASPPLTSCCCCRRALLSPSSPEVLAVGGKVPLFSAPARFSVVGDGASDPPPCFVSQRHLVGAPGFRATPLPVGTWVQCRRRHTVLPPQPEYNSTCSHVEYWLKLWMGPWNVWIFIPYVDIRLCLILIDPSPLCFLQLRLP